MAFRANIMVAARADAEMEPRKMLLCLLMGILLNRRRPGARNSLKERMT
jgi:hypothetical protein